MSIPEISPEDAKTALDAGGPLVLDIRDSGSYAAGHIPGARAISNANMAEFLAETPKDQALIVCCYHGNSSRGATAFLIEQGYTQTQSLSQGYAGWQLRNPTAIESGA